MFSNSLKFIKFLKTTHKQPIAGAKRAITGFSLQSFGFPKTKLRNKISATERVKFKLLSYSSYSILILLNTHPTQYSSCSILILLNTYPIHPTHPTHPTHPSHPTHPVHPTHSTYPYLSFLSYLFYSSYSSSRPTYLPHPTHPRNIAEKL